MTATFAFIHGAGDVGWYWHLVEADLRGRGHETVAPDLPIEDDRAGLAEYADVVIDAIGSRPDVVMVAQSFGGYVAPIVAEKVRRATDRPCRSDGPDARRNRGGDVREHGLAAGESRGLERAIRLLPRRPIGARGSGAHARATSIRHARVASRGRFRSGRTSRRVSSCAAMTGSSPRGGCGRWFAIVSGSIPTRSRAATARH